jgi:conserved oligomeric Golgi complex subunit 1
MAGVNLLNLDVDQIFEQNNVNEIEVINRKVQAEIEKKREELRMMVN